MARDTEEIKVELEKLKAELTERRRSVPAHTIRPHQLVILEELEEKIAELEEELGSS